VKTEILRKYLEITSLNNLNEVLKPSENYNLQFIHPNDFQLNKFFYKQIGENHHWVDRLIWTENKWIEYVSNKSLYTFILKDREDLAGYFELIFHKNENESEIVYFGILKEYFGKKLGGFLISEAIKKSFSMGAKRVWLHTSSLDHENALKNYLSRGMTIFKSETLN